MITAIFNTDYPAVDYTISHDLGKINRTHLQGELKTLYSTLVKKFGHPNIINSDKTSALWIIEDKNKTIATIYDWKNEGHSIENTIDWHVGGFDKKSFELVKLAIGEVNLLSKNDLKSLGYR